MDKKYILIDVGSSSLKIYKLEDQNLEFITTNSIQFKNGFSPESGITSENQEELFEYINQLKLKYWSYEFKIYATAIFRKFDEKAKERFTKEFKARTGLDFNIVDHEKENLYLEKALIGKSQLNEPILLINIGGGSTELIIVSNQEVLERHNLDLGVMTVMEKFPFLNESFSSHKLDDVISTIKEKLPDLLQSVHLAIYSGGELNYMKLVGYGLENNNIFKDSDHPSKISLRNFQSKNQEVFSGIELSKLESLMPHDPKWMYGARSCSAIAQAICEKYGIEFIIPSDSNLINGVVREEYNL